MSKKNFTAIDGNQAVAEVAYRLNDVIIIYPITPSSPMAEWADQWASEGRPNLAGAVPSVVEMQSEAGAAGAVHGALQTGSITTTFTASQGLLLMIPNMYKIAGELTPAVFHIAARSLAAQGLSIFGDHSDVMAARATGWAMLASNSVQEAMDFSLIAHMASFETRIPFMHFFDGFRTSHEVNTVEMLTDDQMRSLLKPEWAEMLRSHALTPEKPVLRGTAQNPDVAFQARETVNPFYAVCSDKTQQAMDAFARVTGRSYQLVEYIGAPDAERVIVLMGSGAETAEETVKVLASRGEKVGVLKIRLFRPFDTARFLKKLPPTVRSMAVLDRTKEPGSAGEPLYLDVLAALQASPLKPRVIGGRYGLSSKEFTPAMVKGIFDHLNGMDLKHSFTIGIDDNVSGTSLPYHAGYSIEAPEVIRGLFYGLGSDGTVGANKNSIKIISDYTDNYAQGYFVYDSKKSGAMTVSHLRFGPKPIRAPYLVQEATFIGCHQWVFLERYDMLAGLAAGGTFLINSPYPASELWDRLPATVQKQLIDKKARCFAIDAIGVAREAGLGPRINTIMQVCFFALSGVLPKEKALEAIRKAIQKTYGSKGDDIVQLNLKAVDSTLAHLAPVPIGNRVTARAGMTASVPAHAPAFVKNVLSVMIENRGDSLPVGALPADGTYPTGTTQYEKRNLAQEIPVWDPGVCIQCGKCVLVCPHSVIRMKVVGEEYLAGAPSTFKTANAMDRDWKGMKFSLQVAAEDCTGCTLCVEICPARNKSEAKLKAINMRPQAPLRETERENWDFFLRLPEVDRRKLNVSNIRQQQFQQPLFEFSSACPGCGETPYLKLLSQLFGDRSIIANATGCSSIYGGNLPTTPWTQNAEGRGPAWANSLFEDNAEFGMGYRVSLNHQHAAAGALLRKLSGIVGSELVESILSANQRDEAGVYEQRQRIAQLKKKLDGRGEAEARSLRSMADSLIRKSVWIVGGDGWAYDIGYGGLDHVLASGLDVNVLVLDTEVYSNTGGQMSKSTPRAAVAKFAAGGKPMRKKDLGLMAMSYGHVYVGCVAMGARDEHTLRTFLEAEAYNGPSLIIAYSHCIAHGINMNTAFQTQKAAVDSGDWILYRYHPDRVGKGENPLQLDSPDPKLPLAEYLNRQNRFKMLTKSHPDRAKELWNAAQEGVRERRKFYEYLASRPGAAAPQEVRS